MSDGGAQATEASAPGSPPDLVLTAITWSPQSPVAGEEVTFRATIKNRGGLPTSADVPHGVLFKIDAGSPTYFGCWSGGYTGPLAPGASVTVTADGGYSGATWSASTGTHTVLAIVDDVNRIEESDEANNELQTTLSVSAGPTPPAMGTLAPAQSPWNPPVGNPSDPSGSVSVKAGYYFVDSSAGSDSNSGTSPSAAWRTLAKVKATAFKPGNVIHFKRGETFSGGLIIDDSGTAASPIVFSAYGTGPAPILTNPPLASGGSKVVDIAADWVVVEGLTLRDAHAMGVNIRSGAEHNVVRQVEITKVGNAVEVHGDYNLVTQSYIHDLHMVVNTSGGTPDYGATGVVLFAHHNEVSYNRIVNCIAPSYDFKVDGGAIEFYGRADNNYVHHNWGQHIDGFVETGAGSSGSCRNNTLAFNVSIDSHNKFACFHLGGTYQAVVENFRMEHNTIVLNPSETCYQAILFNGGKPTEKTLLFRNNILYTRNTDKIANVDGFTHSNNLYHSENNPSWSGAITLGPTEKRGNPLFVDLSKLDLRLAAGSPAINAGADLAYAEDLEGHKLPCGVAPELGAFEHGCP